MTISGRAPVPVAPRWMAGGGRGAELRADVWTDEQAAESLEVSEAEGVRARDGEARSEARVAGREAVEVGREAVRWRRDGLAVRHRELARRRSELEARAARRSEGGGRGLGAPEAAAVAMARDDGGPLPHLAEPGELVEAVAGVYRGRGGEAREGGGQGERVAVAVAEAVTAARGWREAEATRRSGGVRVRREEGARRGGVRRAEFDVEGDLRLELGR